MQGHQPWALAEQRIKTDKLTPELHFNGSVL
jgi:hypothetical protein